MTRDEIDATIVELLADEPWPHAPGPRWARRWLMRIDSTSLTASHIASGDEADEYVHVARSAVKWRSVENLDEESSSRLLTEWEARYELDAARRIREQKRAPCED